MVRRETGVQEAGENAKREHQSPQSNSRAKDLSEEGFEERMHSIDYQELQYHTDLALKYGFRRCVGLEGIKELFRSRDISQINKLDTKKLKALGISTIFDLRSDSERSATPYPQHLAQSFLVLHYPLENLHGVGRVANRSLDEKPGELINKTTTITTDRSARSIASDIVGAYGLPGERMTLLYSGMALFLARIQTLAHQLIDTEGGVLIHCRNGKDRVGVVCAYVQLMLGVSYSEVMDDYLVSNTYNKLMNKSDLEFYAKTKSAKELATLQAMFEARPEYLETFLYKVIEGYENQEFLRGRRNTIYQSI